MNLIGYEDFKNTIGKRVEDKIDFRIEKVF